MMNFEMGGSASIPFSANEIAAPSPRRFVSHDIPYGTATSTAFRSMRSIFQKVQMRGERKPDHPIKRMTSYLTVLITVHRPFGWWSGPKQ